MFFIDRIDQSLLYLMTEYSIPTNNKMIKYNRYEKFSKWCLLSLIMKVNIIIKVNRCLLFFDINRGNTFIHIRIAKIIGQILKAHPIKIRRAFKAMKISD